MIFQLPFRWVPCDQTPWRVLTPAPQILSNPARTFRWRFCLTCTWLRAWPLGWGGQGCNLAAEEKDVWIHRDPWGRMAYWPTCMVDFYGKWVNVGKYTSLMDPMGIKKHQATRTKCNKLSNFHWNKYTKLTHTWSIHKVSWLNSFHQRIFLTPRLQWTKI